MSQNIERGTIASIHLIESGSLVMIVRARQQLARL
jgi:hypothetical protein